MESIVFDVYMAEISHYVHINKYNKALELADKALSEEPLDSDLLHIKGMLLHDLDRYEEALKYCLLALQNSNNKEIHLLIGNVYYALEDHVKAEESYLEVLRLDPRHVKGFCAYAKLMMTLNQMEKASKLLDEAVSIDPNDYIVLLSLFRYNALMDKGNKQLALVFRMFESNPSEVNNSLVLASLEYKNGHKKKAFELVRDYYLQDPTDKKALVYLKFLEREKNPLFYPHRLIDKLGGGFVVWGVALGLALLLRSLEMNELSGIVVLVYILLALYTWLVYFGFKIYDKYKEKLGGKYGKN